MKAVFRYCCEKVWVVLFLLAMFCLSEARAGGGWVAKPGRGYLQLGYSRKTAEVVWDAKGNDFFNRNAAGDAHYHDFRYGYFSGEIGLFSRVSGHFLMTYLWGYEGYKNTELEENFGLSDAWFGANFQLQEGSWPMSLRANIRTPFFYDQKGPYVRHLYNTENYRRPDGTVVRDSTFLVMNNPEWRGLLRYDYTFSYNLSHSFLNYSAWMSFELGFTYRQGAPADEVPVNFELGYTLPLRPLEPMLKFGVNLVRSLHNESRSEPHDRFNFPPNSAYTFNDASMARASLALLVPINERFMAQVGYGQWVWGRGARQYKEPFVSLGYALGAGH
ncbi:hypothetical protein HUU05_14815 [candidate division KSB1 bacterium]|nr:hypothetical protein [candidate division KSB1 bacterium]